MKSSLKRIALAALFVVGMPSAGMAAPSPAQLAFFENYVRPVLVNECYRCHSNQEGSIKGGLAMDSKDALFQGGDTGKAVVPGRPELSLLVKAIQYVDEDLQMPPKKQLDAAQVRALTQWVLMGAPYPDTGPMVVERVYDSEATGHWAFQPPQRPTIPVVQNTAWPQTPVDYFILARMEQAGIEPSPMADKRTLLRRATFDLIGLPPTTAEVEAFVKDESPKAFEKVVDRLLDSEHYGERWGRHWLDVARYADTKGDANRTDVYLYPYAWAYRDFVIRSFNEDKPYDLFVKEQLAADLMLPLRQDKNPDSLAALGFLTLGNRFDGQQEEIINDRIDTVTKAFQGLTVSCARCHDHKFDPIPTSDYYAMRGIFMSTREPESDELPLMGRPEQTPEFKDFMAEYQKRQQDLQKFYTETINNWLETTRQKAPTYLAAYAETGGNQAEGIAKLREQKMNYNDARYGLALWRKIVSDGRDRRSPLYAIFGAWHEFARLPDNRSFAQGARQVITDMQRNRSYNPEVVRAFRSVLPQNMVQVAQIYGSLFVKAETQFQEMQKITSNATRLRNSNLESFRGVAYMVDYRRNVDRPYEKVFRYLPRNMQGQETRFKTRIAELEMNHAGAPPRAMVLLDDQRPTLSPIFIRGERDSRGDTVPHRFLKALGGTDQKPYSRTVSGRLELANDIASKSNPLTARVMINRIWQHHFGEGFVPTPDDLGVQADNPSHPQLLDWLAHYFMEHGWSMKQVHKLIMLSSVYQQTSEVNPRFAQIDPNNKLLWHFNILMLEFEALRDSMLAIGGKLNKQMYGKPFDLEQENANRRTVYAKIDRGRLPELLNHFNFANPDMASGKRHASTVPQQTLFMMNSPMVVELAKYTVNKKAFQDLKSPEERVRYLYEIFFQRLPDEKEIDLGVRFIETNEEGPAVTESDTELRKVANRKGRGGRQQDARRQPLDAWQKYAHALLQTNEMCFIN